MVNTNRIDGGLGAATPPLVEANLKTIATKRLRQDIAKELTEDDPINPEDVLEENEIEDDNAK